MFSCHQEPRTTGCANFNTEALAAASLITIAIAHFPALQNQSRGSANSLSDLCDSVIRRNQSNLMRDTPPHRRHKAAVAQKKVNRASFDAPANPDTRVDPVTSGAGSFLTLGGRKTRRSVCICAHPSSASLRKRCHRNCRSRAH